MGTWTNDAIRKENITPVDEGPLNVLHSTIYDLLIWSTNVYIFVIMTGWMHDEKADNF